MIKGVLLGSVSALALSTLLVVSVVLIAPPPERSARPVSSVPDAPVLRDQAESTPRVPERPAEDLRRAETPVPQPAERRIDTAVEVPAASQFNRPREDGTVITPGVEATPRPLAVTEGLRTEVTPVAAPQPSTESAEQPVPRIISGFGSAPLAGDAPAVPGPKFETAPRTFGDIGGADTAEDAPLATEDAAPAEADPVEITRDVSDAQDATGPDVSTPVEAEPAPVVAETAPVLDADVPDAPEAPEAQVAPLPAPGEVLIVDAPLVPAREPAPQVPEGPDADAPEAQTVGIAEADPADLPRRLVLDSARDEEADIADESAVPETDAPAASRALIDNAAAFENPQGLPLMSIVLIDTPGGGVDRDSLMGFDFPVTFAIDPTRDDADAVATAYRAAGHEVVALADIFPVGATAQDIEVAMSALQREFPQAVGLLDRASGSLVSDRRALGALLPAMAEAGMGLLAYPGGLNTGVTTAVREGVPAVTLYRVLDANAERAPRITRFLDRATFEAAQDGATVVIGRTTPETVSAIASWRQGNRASQVAAAPLSAVLTAQSQ